MHRLAMLMGRSALVLKELKINPNGPQYVRIVGRRAGIIGWLLSALGIDTTTTFDISEKRIDFIESSLSGRISHMYPMASVSNIGTGYTKPAGYLVLMAILILYGFSTLFVENLGVVGFFMLVFAAVFGVLYYLRKAMTIFIQVNSGSLAIMVVKRSMVEGVAMEEAQAQQVIAILIKLTENSH